MVWRILQSSQPERGDILLNIMRAGAPRAKCGYHRTEYSSKAQCPYDCLARVASPERGASLGPSIAVILLRFTCIKWTM